jgi:formate dehydrogenase subunit gamma
MQPSGRMTSPGEISQATRAIASELARLEGPLLPILHAVQERFGHVPGESLPVIADVLNLSRAEVHGVSSFYHDFRHEPAGRHTVKVCRAEACQSMGSANAIAGLERALGVRLGETSADGRVTLEAVYCLGLCACAPAALVDGEPVGRVDDEAVAEIAKGCRT